MFEGLVAQDVTTPPLANEGDMNTGPGQQHAHTLTRQECSSCHQDPGSYKRLEV